MIRIFLLITCFVFTEQATALTGMYTEVSSGYSSQDNLFQGTSFVYSQKSSNNFHTARASVGYIHDFNPSVGFGMESGYGSFVKTTYHAYDSVFRFSSETLEFLLVLKAYLASYDFYLKFGGIRNTIHYAKDDYQNFRVDQQPEFVIGGGYNFGDHLAVTLAYQRTFGGLFTKHILTEVPQYNPNLSAILVGSRLTFY